MEKFFKLSDNKTNFRTEVIAGFTTFFTMAYIIFVNPNMLAETGMDYGSVTVATCLAAAIGTLLIGLMSNYPFAQAPGMGLNAFFVYTVCFSMAWQWEGALAAVFISGIIFIVITLSGARGAILNAVPRSLKYAIGAGIGLFIASIGLKNGSMLSISESGFFIGSFANPLLIHTLIGIILTIILMVLKVKGAILIGIVISAVIGIVMPDGTGSTITALSGVTLTPLAITGFIMFALLVLFVIVWGVTKKKVAGILAGVSLAATVIFLILNLVMGDQSISMAGTFMKMDFTAMFPGNQNMITEVISFITVILAFLMIDMFDTMGTIIGTAEKAGYLDKDGNLPKANQAMMADAIATAVGAAFGTSTVTTYVESVAGVNEGGRTGLTSVVVAILFVLALIFAPIAGIIPSTATAPALIVVGILMMSPLKKIDWDNFAEAAPAFMTILMMAFTSSITDGIAFGFFTYVICKVFTKKAREIGGIMWGIVIVFIIYYVMRAIVIG
ncbi:NCS2 family permease [Christensenellaceae bacterium OttesenSCG-928-K19]|nr:NCS2 family permease [Christensenellaceae bacterium OttesenSCG-928-K19]